LASRRELAALIDQAFALGTATRGRRRRDRAHPNPQRLRVSDPCDFNAALLHQHFAAKRGANIASPVSSSAAMQASRERQFKFII
jgi:hypothetical protein